MVLSIPTCLLYASPLVRLIVRAGRSKQIRADLVGWCCDDTSTKPRWISLAAVSGVTSNNQMTLNVLNTEAVRQQQPVVSSTMGDWGGTERYYHQLDNVYGIVNLLPWWAIEPLEELGSSTEQPI
jgi:hypothetical protein